MDKKYTSDQKPMIVKYAAHQNAGIQPHNIRRYGIGFIIRGKKYIYDGDSRFEVKAGEVFFLSIGNHYMEDIPEKGKNFEQIIFYYNPEQLSKIISNLILNYNRVIDNDHTCEKCQDAKFLVCPEWGVMKSFFKITNQYLMDDMLREDRTVERLKMTELIYMIISREDCCMKNRILSSMDSVKENFEQIIHKNIFSDISIIELAAQCNRSITSFKKDFKKNFGDSPHKWFIRQRLMYTRLQLISTNKSIAEIGQECSFTNTSHFIKLFKKEFAETPATYRKMYNNSERNNSYEEQLIEQQYVSQK